MVCVTGGAVWLISYPTVKKPFIHNNFDEYIDIGLKKSISSA
jgi:hypothetical protein